MARSLRIGLCTAALVLLAGCGEDQEPEEARDLWERLEAEGFRSWKRAPGYEGRVESRAAHGDEVVIYVNDVVADALDEGTVASWPDGSIIAKDGFSGGDLCLVAAMEKRDGEWFWAEYDAEGETLFSGTPEVCTGCHRIGDDWVRGFYLP